MENKEELINSEETREFLEEVNTTQKKLGHNKLQLEIDGLRNEITRLKKIDVEKEMKLTLFKKNISTLQTQSQERLDEISRLKIAIQNNPQTLEVNDLTKQIDELKILNNNLKNNLQEKERLYNTQVSINKELEVIKDKARNDILNLNTQLESLKKHMDDITKNKDDLQIEVNKLKSQVELKSNVSENVVLELQELKDELIKYKSANQLLEDELKKNEEQSSNISLQLQEVEQQLHVQLEHQKSKTVLNNKSANNSIVGRHRGLKQSSRR